MQLDPDLADALALKAAQLRRTVFDIENQAVRLSLEEERSYLAAFDERAYEPTISLEVLLHDLKTHGKIWADVQEIRVERSSRDSTRGNTGSSTRAEMKGSL